MSVLGCLHLGVSWAQASSPILHGRYGVVFQWAVQRTAEQWISVVAGASIVCAYGVAARVQVVGLGWRSIGSFSVEDVSDPTRI